MLLNKAIAFAIPAVLLGCGKSIAGVITAREDVGAGGPSGGGGNTGTPCSSGDPCEISLVLGHDNSCTDDAATGIYSAHGVRILTSYPDGFSSIQYTGKPSCGACGTEQALNLCTADGNCEFVFNFNIGTGGNCITAPNGNWVGYEYYANQ